MKPVSLITGPTAPLMLADIDTETIVRVERLMEFQRGELGPFLFESLRFFATGDENPAFILNRHGFRHSTILIAGENFGCGSSREAAVWALQDFGIQCVIAPSFGDIFAGNCVQNGLLPITLDIRQLTAIVDEIDDDRHEVTVDLDKEQVMLPSGRTIGFSLFADQRQRLLKGEDEISQTLQWDDAIACYQAAARVATPWLFVDHHRAL